MGKKRLVGGAGIQNGMVPHPQVAVKNQEGYVSCRGYPWREPGPPAHGSSADKKSSHNFWLWKQVEIVAEWGEGS